MLQKIFCIPVIFMVLSLCFNCNKKMTDEQFIALYVKIAKSTEQNLSQPEKLKAIHDKIFTENGFTRKAFQEFEKRYKNKPEKWLEIWKQIEKESAAGKNK